MTLGWARNAGAEIVLVEKDGWEVYTEGRVGAFGSVALGQDIPAAADPNRPLLTGIFGSDNEQADTSGNTVAFRLRSGLMPNIFAVGFRKKITESTTLGGYVALWASADTNRVKYTKSAFDVRQGYLQLKGPWGSFLAGRAMALFSRGNFEIDYLYQHGYGFGHPCKIDSSGEEAGFTGGGSCGQMGFGVLHPSYDAGLVYATPSLGGLTITVGLYDPVGNFSPFPRTPYPRPEGEVAFERKLGSAGMVKLFASGMWQRSQRISTTTDAGGMMVSTLVSQDAYGAAGGGRLELGPLRVGGGGYTGKGVGTHIALNTRYDRTIFHDGTFNYRTTDGFYGALAGVFGKFQVNAGFGMARVHLLPEDSMHGDPPNGIPDPSPFTVPKQQFGISGGMNVHISPELIFDVDYFRAHSEWYDGKSQDMNVVSSGLTMVW